MNYPTLGIDIAKKTFQACLLNAKPKHKSFANTPAGFAELDRWLKAQSVTQVKACMEATGPYWDELARHLFEAGHKVSVSNPFCLHHYAKSQLLRSKTDKIDATMIARYAAEKELPAWTPPAPEFARLRTLSRTLQDLQQMVQEAKNHLASELQDTEAKAVWEALLADLNQAVKGQEERIREHVASHPILKEQVRLLLTIKGVGEATAITFLAEVGDIKGFTRARQVAALAGLSCKLHESGQFKGKTTLSKRGNAILRKALYFPALAAKRSNPAFQAFANRLLARGKTKMCVIGACMRKLIQVMYGVLRSGQPYAPLGIKLPDQQRPAQSSLNSCVAPVAACAIRSA